MGNSAGIKSSVYRGAFVPHQATVHLRLRFATLAALVIITCSGISFVYEIIDHRIAKRALFLLLTGKPVLQFYFLIEITMSYFSPPRWLCARAKLELKLFQKNI
jgi:hypothetical protein